MFVALKNEISGLWENPGVGSVNLGAWNPGYALGAWGVDTSANVAWLVTNHNSEFAVVPEPSTLLLLLLGGLGLAFRRGKR